MVNGSNNDVLQLLVLNPQLGLDLGLIESKDQKTGGSGSVKNSNILQQKGNSINKYSGETEHTETKFKSEKIYC